MTLSLIYKFVCSTLPITITNHIDTSSHQGQVQHWHFHHPPHQHVIASRPFRTFRTWTFGGSRVETHMRAIGIFFCFVLLSILLDAIWLISTDNHTLSHANATGWFHYLFLHSASSLRLRRPSYRHHHQATVH